MSETATGTAGAWSYRTGDWFAVFGTNVTILLPASQKDQVVALWALVDGGAAFDEVLDGLLASGLSRIPGFVLVSTDEGPTRVLLRGQGVTASLATGEDDVALDGSASHTWVERSVEGVTALTVDLPAAQEPTDESGESGDPVDFPIVTGLVRVGRVDRPALAPAAPAAPAGDVEGAGDAAAVVVTDPLADEPVEAIDVLAEEALPAEEPTVPPVGAPAGEPADEPADEQVEEPVEEVALEAAPLDDGTATEVLEVVPDPFAEPDADSLADPLTDPLPSLPPVPSTPPVPPLPPVPNVPAPPLPPVPPPPGPAPDGWVTPWDGPSADPADATAKDADADAPEQPEQPDQPEGPTDDASTGALESDTPAVPAPPPLPPAGETEVPPTGWVPPPPPSAPGVADAPPLPVGSWEPVGGVERPPAPQEAAPFDPDHDGQTMSGASAAVAPPAPGIPGQPQAPAITQPVAKLLVSDGQSIVVDRAVLIGRAPEARRFTSTEQPTLVTVPSRLHEISSTHIEVRPGTGADHGTAVVTDMGSTNGTVLVQPGLGPEDLKPGIAVQLIPGAIINLGDGITIQVTRP